MLCITSNQKRNTYLRYILDKKVLKRKLEIKDEDDEEPVIPKEKMIVKQCPYLDTINRHVLDFDFEKLCSVSLTRINGKHISHF